MNTDPRTLIDDLLMAVVYGCKCAFRRAMSSLRIRWISSIAAALCCTLCPEIMTFSDCAPGRCALR